MSKDHDCDHDCCGDYQEFVGMSQKLLWGAFGIAFIWAILQYAGGCYVKSWGLIADAGHVSVDAGAIGIALLAGWLASRNRWEPAKDYAALLNGGILVIMGIAVLFFSFRRIFHPNEIKSGIMIIIAVIGLFANFAQFVVLEGKKIRKELFRQEFYKRILKTFLSREDNGNNGKDEAHVHGAKKHVASDAAASVGVIAGGVAIYTLSLLQVIPIIGIVIDSLLGVGIAVLIVRSGKNLIKRQVKRIWGPKILKES